MKQETIRVTKTFTFDMAHALFNHDGPCRNIHGHTYHLSVTIIGKAKQEQGHPKDGMLIDFGDLKKLVHEHVVSQFDHALVLNNYAPNSAAEVLQKHYEKIILLSFQPSCENLIIEIKNRIMISLNHTNVSLHSLKLYETPTSYAEWFITDNA